MEQFDFSSRWNFSLHLVNSKRVRLLDTLFQCVPSFIQSVWVKYNKCMGIGECLKYREKKKKNCHFMARWFCFSLLFVMSTLKIAFCAIWHEICWLLTHFFSCPVYKASTFYYLSLSLNVLFRSFFFLQFRFISDWMIVPISSHCFILISFHWTATLIQFI